MKLLIAPLLLATLVAQLHAQTPPVQEAPAVTITNVTVETASLPGSSLTWTKMIASFTTTEKWLDGVAFSAAALVGAGSQARLVTGNVRYANIPAGTHSAILYLSPRATERFGAPQYVEFTAFHRDAEVSQKAWTNPALGTLPENWRSLNNYSGVLVNVTRTPWILVDYDKTPDISSN